VDTTLSIDTSGLFTLDTDGDIYLDGDGGDFKFRDGGVSKFTVNSSGVNIAGSYIELNYDNDEGSTFIDFHSGGDTGYDFRLLRDTGADGDVTFRNKGTGSYKFYVNISST